MFRRQFVLALLTAGREASGTARRNRWALLVALTVATSTMQAVVAQSAQATTSSVDQHWELLNETRSITAALTTIPLQRGVIPGGTTKFDPAPTVSFEVAGRHTGGTGQAKYEVRLNYGPSSSVAVNLMASDSTFTIKKQSFTWPSVDRSLTSITVTKINDGLNLAGAVEITKAYLAIRQTGTIMKTVTRVSLATKQSGITNTAWQDVADPFYYRHDAADFSPVPVVYLRTSGVEVTSNPILMSLHVRLVNDAGTPITGAETLHTSFGSATTGALALNPGGRYHLQVNVTQAPESGELHSADLVLEQSTSDAQGIVRSVGWYAGVTAATTVATDSYMNFLFTPPQLTLSGSSGTWYTGIKRLSCGTGAVRADLKNPAGDTLVMSGQATSSSSFDYLYSDPITQPTADTTVKWDTRSVPDPGCSARVAGTAWRVVQQLRPALTFTADVSTLLSSGTFDLYTLTSTAWKTPVTIATGVLPPSGILNVTVPLDALTASPSQHYFVSAARPIDDTYAYVAFRGTGLTTDDIVDNTTRALGSADVWKTNWFDSDTEFAAALSAGTITNTLERPASSVPGGTIDPMTVSPPQPVCSGSSPDWRCGDAQTSDTTPSCATTPPQSVPYTCVTEQQDFPADVLRGVSQRSVGQLSTFRVKNGTVQIWQKGVRMPGQGFSVEGTSSRKVETSIADEWPQRGDCWDSSPPADQGTCDGGSGHQLKYGTNTWRRQQTMTVHPSPLAPWGARIYNERLFDVSYNGGQSTYLLDAPLRLSHYYARPSFINGGYEGNVAVYSEYGGTSTRQYERTDTYSYAASIFINSSFGAAQFDSSMSYSNSTLVEQTFVFRSSSAVGWMIYRWYAYDNSYESYKWPRIHWSCELQSGYVENGSCRNRNT